MKEGERFWEQKETREGAKADETKAQGGGKRVEEMVHVHVYLPTTSAISPAGRAPSKPPRANIDSDTFISNEVNLV